jgi:hypothetical protein
VANNSSEFTFQSCTFVNNIAPVPGDHILINPSSIATLRNCVIGAGCNGSVAFSVSGTLDVDCSVVQDGPASITGGGTVLYGASNVVGDPLFCDPADCSPPAYPAGTYTIDSVSPASSSYHPCGLAGAYPVACGVTSASASLRVDSWGRIKGRYLDP